MMMRLDRSAVTDYNNRGSNDLRINGWMCRCTLTECPLHSLLRPFPKKKNEFFLVLFLIFRIFATAVN